MSEYESPAFTHCILCTLNWYHCQCYDIQPNHQGLQPGRGSRSIRSAHEATPAAGALVGSDAAIDGMAKGVGLLPNEIRALMDPEGTIDFERVRTAAQPAKKRARRA